MKDTIYMTNTTGGSNKFYKMTDLGNNKWRAHWGPIGKAGQTMDYDMSEWDKKYQEKLKKKYVVQTRTINTSAPAPASQTGPATSSFTKPVPPVQAAPPQKVEIDPEVEKKVKTVGDIVRKSKRPAMTVDLQQLRIIEKKFYQTGVLTKKDMEDLNTLYKQYK